MDCSLLPRQRTPPPTNFAEKTFANSHKTAKFTKVFSLKSLPLYGMCGVTVLLLFLRAAEAARSVPNVKIMVDHCGLPYERDDATMRVWREGGCRREGRRREGGGKRRERRERGREGHLPDVILRRILPGLPPH